jgi:hypothetical protein
MDYGMYWRLAGGVMERLWQCYLPAMDAAAARHGLGLAWHTLLAVPLFATQPVTAELLSVRAPFTHPSTSATRLEELGRTGMLEGAPGGGWHISQRGEQVYQDILQAAYAAMASVVTPPKVERLADMLFQLVQASLDAHEPPGKWCIRLSRKTDPGAGLGTLARIDQYLSDLNSYRDDAHLAAWQPLGVSGQAWDALSCLWRDEADMLEAIQAKLARRGFSAAEYANALADLAETGWVESSGSLWLITELGAQVRQDAEERTDAYFFAPWQCLVTADLDALADGLRVCAFALHSLN